MAEQWSWLLILKPDIPRPPPREVLLYRGKAALCLLPVPAGEKPLVKQPDMFGGVIVFGLGVAEGRNRIVS